MTGLSKRSMQTVNGREPKLQTHTEWLAELFEREDFLRRNIPPCPKCEARQVQQMSKAVPAEWKCRECQFKWRQEPREF